MGHAFFMAFFALVCAARPYRLTVRTPFFQDGNAGATPARVNCEVIELKRHAFACRARESQSAGISCSAERDAELGSWNFSSDGEENIPD